MTRYYAITADDQVHHLGQRPTYLDALLEAKRIGLHMPTTIVRTGDQLVVVRNRINDALTKEPT